ncbi:MAG: hypothetical protein RLZZ383_826 [Pseudomonadota bacterium]|jgi:general secretion pathway protein L
MPRTLAIDLGSRAVKVAVDVDGVAEVVSRTVVFAAESDPAVELDARLQALDALLDEHPAWVGAQVDLVWGSDRSAVRRVSLPFAEKERVDATLPFAIEQDVPFDLDDMHLAWRPTEVPTTVLAVLAPQAALSATLAALKARGLDPRRVIPDGEVLGAWGPADEAVEAVVDLGHRRSVVAVVQAGRTLWFRSIDAGGANVQRAVAAALGVAAHEAAALLWDPDTQEPVALEALPPNVAQAVLRARGPWLGALRATLLQAEDELGVEIAGVRVCGGAAVAPEWLSALEEDLGVPVGRAYEGHPADALAAALLADATLAKPSPWLDLRSGRFAFVSSFSAPSTWLRLGAAFAASYLIAVGGAFGVLYLQGLDALTTAEDATRATVAEVLDGVSDNMEPSRAVLELGEAVAESEEIGKFLGGDGDAPEQVHLLYDLHRAFPPADKVVVEIDRVEVTPKAVMVNGRTDGLTQVDQIQEALEASGAFDRIEATSSNKADKVEFTLNIARMGAEAEDGSAEGDAAPAEEGG